MDLSGQQFEIGYDGIASEQIFHVDGAQIAHLDMARSDVLERRQGLHRDGERFHSLKRHAAFAAKCRWRGQQNLFHVFVGDDFADLLWPRNLDPVHQLAGKRGVRVDEGDGPVIAGLVQRAQQLNADGSGAVDDDVLPLVEADRPMLRGRFEEYGAGPLPAQADEPRGDQGIDHHHRAGLPLNAAHQHHQRPDQRGDDNRRVDARRAFRPDEAGDELVKTAPIEDEDAYDRRRQHEQKNFRSLGDVDSAEAQGIGSPQRDGEHREIVQDQNRPLKPARTLDQPNGYRHDG